MKQILLLVTLVTILYRHAAAQDPEVFDKIYMETYLETSHTDFNKAIEVADSLFEHAEGTSYKVRSLMLSATLYQQAGDLSNAAVFAEKAQGIAVQTNDYSWQARIGGFLASQYRWLKLYEKSERYAAKAMEAAKKISNPESANSTIGLMYQEQAYVALEQKKYHKVIEDVRNAQRHFNNASKKDLEMLTANNEQLTGDAYAGLKLYDSSLHYYNRGLRHLEKLPENYVGGLILSGMAGVYIEQGEMSKAKLWLDSAQGIADRSHYQQLKLVVYGMVKKYAQRVVDMEQLDQAQKMQDTAQTVITFRKDSFLNQKFSALEQSYLKEAEQGSYKNILILVALLLIVGIIIFVAVTRRKQKARFRAVIAGIKERETIRHKEILPSSIEAMPLKEDVPLAYEPLHKAVATVMTEGAGVPLTEQHTGIAKEEQPREMPVIPEETTQKILAALEEFENGTVFRNRNISLSYLAAHINTNTKYLSRVINQHKQKDFNGYINELRVNYIIERLRKDTVWRQYKISTLAEEAGFSSHSKFAAVFKSITGISPSLFIQYLEEDSRNI